MGEKGKSAIRYVSPFADSEARQDVLLAAFEEKRALDLRRGMTSVGPHRDDLELTLDGRDLRLFGSAGQQRSAAIALRLLEGSDAARSLRRGAAASPRRSGSRSWTIRRRGEDSHHARGARAWARRF